MRKNILIPYIPPLILIIFATLLIINSALSDVSIFRNEPINGKQYSIVISILLLIFSLLHIYKNITDKSPSEKENNSLVFKKKIILTLIIGICFVFGVVYIGFYISTLFVCFTFGMIMNDWNKKRIVPLLIYGICFSFILYFINDFIGIYLPETWLI